MTGPIITKLPPELLLKIIEEFCYHCQCPDRELTRVGAAETYIRQEISSCYSTLISLCKTSRFFHRPAQSVLFHFIFTDRDNIRNLVSVLETIAISR